MTDLRKHTTRISIDPRKFLPLILLEEPDKPGGHPHDSPPREYHPIPDSAVFLYAQVNPASGYLELVMSDPSFSAHTVGRYSDLPVSRHVRIKGSDDVFRDGAMLVGPEPSRIYHVPSPQCGPNGGPVKLERRRATTEELAFCCAQHGYPYVIPLGHYERREYAAGFMEYIWPCRPEQEQILNDFLKDWETDSQPVIREESK